ncbi:hypothetical protein MAM1_0407c10368 [Mucor ambiguus]|uniref:F-box domain-containing protein n=1 Tax=Mucor ambiguus TaxID=91626 RepID=A0A0C9N866_9FUNG|nr:hypothetical protein MAM1_0407c10368 [Mucor ambiguus]
MLLCPSIPTDNEKVDIYGYGGIRNILIEIQADLNRGRCILLLSFIVQTGTERPAIRDELAIILNGCPNLAEIVFVDVNPFYYLMYMVEEEVQLPRLELVRVANPHHLSSLGHKFVNPAFYYRRTINQLKIYIGSIEFLLAVGVDNIAAYFHRLSALKHLTLITRCTIVLDVLLDACPSLQKLTLDAPPNAFQPMDTISALAETNIETMEVHHSLMTVELYVYLRDHCRHLTQLLVFGRASDDTNTVMTTFCRFESDKALPIVNISFKDSFTASSAMLEHLHTCFPRVRQVEFREPDFSSVASGNNNITLNFSDLYLQYLLPDIGSILGRKRIVNKVALEVISGDTTTWYQRDGKLKAHHEFNLKDRRSYTKNEARQKRINSNTTAVITIKAAYVNNIRIHATNRLSSLNQLIHLEDDEEDEEDDSE